MVLTLAKFFSGTRSSSIIQSLVLFELNESLQKGQNLDIITGSLPTKFVPEITSTVSFACQNDALALRIPYFAGRGC